MLKLILYLWRTSVLSDNLLSLFLLSMYREWANDRKDLVIVIAEYDEMPLTNRASQTAKLLNAE